MAPNPSNDYRPDIDGLRALAVLPVVLFHGGVEVFSGGFVGVDVFFVISGYLITRIIWSEIQSGTFSILNFYERRARRILPALTVVLLACLAAGFVLALPNQFEALGTSLVYTLFFVSNVFFWQESGYFAPAAELMPLLHTWSLAVEEQFYIAFPIFLLLVSRLSSNFKVFVIATFFLTFCVSLYLSYEKPSVAFYLIPARAWELMLGALLALGIVPKPRSGALCEVVAAAGLGAILAAIFFLDSRVVFPGFAALLPCFGTAAIIHCGRSTAVGRGLSAWPLVGVGLISYSLYLWHWPIFVFSRYAEARIDLSVGASLAGFVLSFGLAWASWRFVERPFRDRRRTATRQFVRLTASVAVVLLLVGSVVWQASGLPGRLDPQAAQLQTASEDIDPLRPECEDPFARGGRAAECRFGNPAATISYVIVGVSHAAAIRPAIEAMFEGSGRAGSLWWRGACPPLLGVEKEPDPDAHRCQRFRSEFMDALRQAEEIDVVVLAGRWALAATGIAPEVGGSFTTWLHDEQTVATGAEENERVFARALPRTVREIVDLGKRVVLVGGVPEPGFDVPVMLALGAFNGRAGGAELEVDDVRDRNRQVDAVLRQAAADPRVTLISVWDLFCPKACELMLDGIPLYSDDDHITLRAARDFVGPRLRARLPAEFGL